MLWFSSVSQGSMFCWTATILIDLKGLLGSKNLKMPYTKVTKKNRAITFALFV